MKKIISFLFLLITTLLFSQDYTNEIQNYSVYQRLKGKPLSDKFSNIESVKVVYDWNDKKLFFFDSKKIVFHFQFVTDYLGYEKGLDVFNNENYSDTLSNRDFLLGNLNHIKNSDKWIFELATSDHMPIETVELFYHLISNNTFIGNNLRFYLNNREKLNWFEQKKFLIPCVTSEYIFNELQYQEVVTGNSVGILKQYAAKDLDKIKPKSNEIIILDGVPDVLPIVKGIIVNELQTPLSHLVILGKNRKIPIMAYTKALSDATFQKLKSKKVELKVAVDTFYIVETTKKINSNPIIKKKKLLADYTVKQLVDLSEINKKGVNSIGAKAQNMSFLINCSTEIGFKTPENAWAIPFYFYNKHIQKKKIQLLINQLLDNKHKDSIFWINQQLKKIRQAIKEEPIDNALIKNLTNKLNKQITFKNFRFRSSTNAEDIDGFNGAGLYESKTGILGDSIKSFEKAIKTVWASVWNESSYYERDYFGIDQNSIAMGVLVHRSFPDEWANGVIISKNLYRDNFTGITINVQIGENSVVKPEKGVVCEQFSVYDFNLFDPISHDFEVDYVSHSNLNNNKAILSTQEINNLYRITKKLEVKMYKNWKKIRFKPVDLEFKIVGENHEIYIKQVRPYND